MFLEECNNSVKEKKVIRYSDDLEISSEDSGKGNSDKEDNCLDLYQLFKTAKK